MSTFSLLLLSSLLIFNGCSLFNKDKTDEGEGASQENSENEGPDESAEAEKNSDDEDLMLDGEEKIQDDKDKAKNKDLEDIQLDSSAEVVAPGTIKNYKVVKNDTLMLIAFKLFGDYTRWKDLKKWNQESLASSNQLVADTLLKYETASSQFIWRPEGTPYLVQTGDTLGTISTKVYGTPAKWKPIWENNKPMIKDPNLIFAGFTIYYKDGKDLASF